MDFREPFTPTTAIATVVACFSVEALMTCNLFLSVGPCGDGGSTLGCVPAETRGKDDPSCELRLNLPPFDARVQNSDVNVSTLR